MSSLFTTSKDAKINTPFGRGKFIPFYLQFVPGYCVDVVHNGNSDREAGDASINTIIPYIILSKLVSSFNPLINNKISNNINTKKKLYLFKSFL